MHRETSPKVCAICQPNFLPWLGYFEMAERADVYVMLDDVQYVRREWGNRNRIPRKGADGWQWLSVPLKKTSRDTLIDCVEISYEHNWQSQMLKTMQAVYGKQPYFRAVFDLIAQVIESNHRRLVDLNVEVIRAVSQYLSFDVIIERSSQFGIDLRKDDKLAALCERLRADVYLANEGSREYIRTEKFLHRGIGFVFQDYHHPEYLCNDGSFQPYMSVIDILCRHGGDSGSIILSGRKRNWLEDVAWPEKNNNQRIT